jgi:hypothetical protein
VFRNGVLAGAYRIDLGQAVDVAAASTWSCNQNGNRGSQHFQLFGSDAAADPGWEYGPGKKFAPIAEVNTAGLAVQRYQATRVRGLPGQSLGRFRWLLWIVYPVTAAQENTAYQEFQVTAAP